MVKMMPGFVAKVNLLFMDWSIIWLLANQANPFISLLQVIKQVSISQLQLLMA